MRAHGTQLSAVQHIVAGRYSIHSQSLFAGTLPQSQLVVSHVAASGTAGIVMWLPFSCRSKQYPHLTKKWGGRPRHVLNFALSVSQQSLLDFALERTNMLALLGSLVR
jgi:hypothetical protein